MREGSESLWQQTRALQQQRRTACEAFESKQTMRGSPFGEGAMAREPGPLRPRPCLASLHWSVGRASTGRGATLTLVAPASESPLAFMVVL